MRKNTAKTLHNEIIVNLYNNPTKVNNRNLKITHWYKNFALHTNNYVYQFSIKKHHSVPDTGNLLSFSGILISPGLHLYSLLVVWSFHKSPEAGYNKLHSDAVGFVNESCNIKRMPLEQPICKHRSYCNTCQPVHRLRFRERRLPINI
jgi:hypothetical protein